LPPSSCLRYRERTRPRVRGLWICRRASVLPTPSGGRRGVALDRHGASFKPRMGETRY
jgi:hypothetical protein